MAKFQSPLLGYNNNVRHKNRVFHIQTEDSGVNHPHIITHLFMDGGRILKSVKKSYAEHVGAEGMAEIVRGLMKEQHKAIFIALRDGQFDDLVDPGAATAAAAKAAATAATAEAKAVADAATADVAAAIEAAALPIKSVSSPEVAAVSAASAGGPATHPDPPRAEADLPPNTIDDARRPANGSVPPPAFAATPEPLRVEEVPPPPPPPPSIREPQPVALVVLPESDPEDVPMTTRQPPDARPHPSSPPRAPSGRELTLDFDALERAAQDAVAAPSLFHASDLPPPPKNLFAREPGTGGAYRAVEADPRHEPRHDSSHRGEEARTRSDPREEPGPRGGARRSVPPPPSARGERPAQTGRGSTRTPSSGSRPPGEARYAPARPAAIFGSTQRPVPQSLFSDELVSDKSLDEVILSYLAEDLEPPRRK